jgi:predicted esterase
MSADRRLPEAREHHLAVTRTARYWTLGEAAGEDPEVWFVLHGYAQLARRFLSRFGTIAEGRLVVAPEALSRFYVESPRGRHGKESVVGATWMTREDREAEIADNVGYLDSLAAEVLPANARVTVLGYSQGVAAAWRWAAYGAARPPDKLVLWAGFFPHDLDVKRAARALEHSQIVMVRGADDRTFGEAAESEEEARLAGSGLVYRIERHAGGHEIDPETLRRVAAG